MKNSIKLTFLSIIFNLVIAVIIIIWTFGFKELIYSITYLPLNLFVGICGLFISGYYISIKMEKLIKSSKWHPILTGIIGLITILFIGIIFGNIIPSSILPEGFDIRRDLVDYVDIPGGGWFPVWLFALTGYSGIILMSYFISMIIKKISLKVKMCSNGIKLPIMLFFIVFVATLPRWFMYTPYQIFRFPMYIVIIYFSYIVIKEKILNKNERKKHVTS